MLLTKDDVTKVAHLARLNVEQNGKCSIERKKLQMFKNSIVDDLNNILQMVEKINELDTENTLPMAHPLDLVLRLRNDEVTEHNVIDAMQTIAPAFGKEGGLYLVPKVVD